MRVQPQDPTTYLWNNALRLLDLPPDISLDKAMPKMGLGRGIVQRLRDGEEISLGSLYKLAEAAKGPFLPAD